MTTTVDPIDPTGGNTNPPVKKQISPAKKWCFTWNNYTDDWKEILVPKFQSSGVFGMQPERGASGTPHIQGWIEFNNKIRPMSLGLPKEIHWEKMRGTVEDSIEYCSKSDTSEGEYITNKKRKRKLPEIKLYGWQEELAVKLQEEPDNRTIHWIWSAVGRRGKSSMVRWLVQEKGALVCAGKAADMKYQIAQYIQKKDDYPDIIVFDVPRSMEQYLSYTGIEEIKNAVFASSKYESDMVTMPWPHVVVFANFPPDLTDKDMSHDRFVVQNVDEEVTLDQFED